MKPPGAAVIAVMQEALKGAWQKSKPEDTKVVIRASATSARTRAAFAHELGFKVVGVSDCSMRVSITPMGWIFRTLAHITSPETGSVRGSALGDEVSNDELLTPPLRCTHPRQRWKAQITAATASQIKAWMIVEGANGPTTLEADDILNDRGVFLVPDILANAGGVVVSYFEWVPGFAGVLLGSGRGFPPA